MTKICNDIIIATLFAIAVLVPVYFDIRIYSAFDLSKITILYILVFVLVITWCTQRINDSSKAYVYSWLMIPIGCYAIVAIISTIFAVDSLTSLLGTYKRYNGLLSLFVYLFMFFIIVNYVKKDMINLFINLIIISACLVCIYGLCQYSGHEVFNWNTDYGYNKRIFSTIGHPAFLSAYLIMVLPLVYYKMIQAQNVYQFVIMLVCVGMIFLTFYMTKTRAAFVALILSHIFFAVFIDKSIIRRNKFKIAMLVLIIITISLVFNVRSKYSVFTRMVEVVKVGESGMKLKHTAESRYNNILMAIEIVKDYPFFGIGFDNLGIVFNKYIARVYERSGKDVRDISEIQDRIHSDFFDVAVNTGLIGLAVYLWCICSYVRMMWRSRNEHKLLILALGTGVFAYFVQNQFSFGHVPIITLFWIFIGMSVVVCKAKQQTQYSTG